MGRLGLASGTPQNWKIAMYDEDGFRLEAAEQFGFETTNDDADKYKCTEASLLAFAKACERKGLAVAKQLVRRELNNPLNAQSQSPLLAIMGTLKKRTDEFDAELTPIREAEEARFMTSRGYVRAPEGVFGKWIKPAIPKVCDSCQNTGWCHAFDKCESTGQPLVRESI